MKPLIEYVRDNKGRRVGCVAAIRDIDGIVLGYSKCMVKPPKESCIFEPDIFNATTAKQKAIGRALSKDEYVPLELALHASKTVSPDIPSSVRPTLRKMAVRASKYFK